MARIYIGPSVLGLTENTIFTGRKFPPHIRHLIEVTPSIEGLIVPTSGLQKSREELSRPGSLLNIQLNKLKKELRGK